jgi:hypothetical protein
LFAQLATTTCIFADQLVGDGLVQPTQQVLSQRSDSQKEATSASQKSSSSGSKSSSSASKSAPKVRTTEQFSAKKAKSTKKAVKADEKIEKELKKLVGTTSHSYIVVDKQKITQKEIPGFSLDELLSLLPAAGWPEEQTYPAERSDIINWLWIERAQQQYRTAAQSLSGKNKPEASLSDCLPQISVYKEHFASIDTMDQFPAFPEMKIRTMTAECRIFERGLIAGVSNAHTFFIETQPRQRGF